MKKRPTDREVKIATWKLIQLPAPELVQPAINITKSNRVLGGRNKPKHTVKFIRATPWKFVGRCIVCGQNTSKLQRHHIPPRRIFKSDKSWELMTRYIVSVCSPCHKQLDNETLSEEGLIKQYRWINGIFKE